MRDRRIEGIRKRIDNELTGLKREIERLFQMYETLNDEPASEKQKRLITRLCGELGLPEPQLRMSKREATNVITFLIHLAHQKRGYQGYQGGRRRKNNGRR